MVPTRSCDGDSPLGRFLAFHIGVVDRVFTVLTNGVLPPKHGRGNWQLTGKEANSLGQATLGSTRFVFDTDDGILTFDSNGAAEGGVIIIATLQSGAALSVADIVIF